jgi:hypothetical protein
MSPELFHAHDPAIDQPVVGVPITSTVVRAALLPLVTESYPETFGLA